MPSPIEWEQWKDYTSKAFPWVLIGAVMLLFNFIIITPSRWEFPYGIAYAIASFAIAILQSSKAPGVLAGLFTALIGGLTIFVSLGGFSANVGMWLGGFLFLGILANEYGLIEWKGRSVNIKTLVAIPFVMWLIWGLTYFGARVTDPRGIFAQLPLQTILYHGGFMALSFWELLRVIGVEIKNHWKVSLALTFITILGMFLTVAMGWGLALL